MSSIALAMVAACASHPFVKISETADLPHEVSKDMQDKFEVRDVGADRRATPSESPSPLSLVQGKPSKKKRGKTDPKAVLVVAGPPVAPSPVPVAPAFVFPSRRPPRDPIWVGEQQVFDITYLGMSAGELTLTSLPRKEIAGRKVYHLKGTALSSKVFSLFYRLNDTVESYWDYEGLFSHRFHVLIDESKQSRDGLELNDSEKGQTFYWNRWNHKERGYSETKEFGPIPSFPQDSLSALYYLRMLPLPEGSVVTFPVASEGKYWEGVVTVLRREVIDSPMGPVKTVVVKPETRFQGVLQKKGDSYIWLTDDDRRYIVRLEAKVRIGTVNVKLKKVEPGTAP